MKVFKFCKKFIFKYKCLFSIYILFNILIGIIAVVTPLLTGKIVDSLTLLKSKEILINYCILFILIKSINITADFLVKYIYIKLQIKSAYALNKYIIEHLQNITMSYFDNVDTVNLNQRINNDSNSIIIFCISAIINIVVNAITIIFVTILLLKINYRITIIMLILILSYILLYSLFKRPLYKKSFESKEVQSSFFFKVKRAIILY